MIYRNISFTVASPFHQNLQASPSISLAAASASSGAFFSQDAPPAGVPGLQLEVKL